MRYTVSKEFGAHLMESRIGRRRQCMLRRRGLRALGVPPDL